MTEEKQKVTDDDLVRVKGRLDPFSFDPFSLLMK